VVEEGSSGVGALALRGTRTTQPRHKTRNELLHDTCVIPHRR
jgi:hypothetical protein